MALADSTTMPRILRMALGMIIFCSADQALALKIIAPAENSTLKAGETITVKLDLELDAGLEKVRYFWYTEHGDTLVEQEKSETAGTTPGTKIADEKYRQKGSASTLGGDRPPRCRGRSPGLHGAGSPAVRRAAPSPERSDRHDETARCGEIPGRTPGGTSRVR